MEMTQQKPVVMELNRQAQTIVTVLAQLLMLVVKLVMIGIRSQKPVEMVNRTMELFVMQTVVQNLNYLKLVIFIVGVMIVICSRPAG